MACSNKRYKLLKDYESPTGKIYKGVIKTQLQWLDIFPKMTDNDFDNKKDWFEDVEEEKYKVKFEVEFGDRKKTIIQMKLILNKPININQLELIEQALNVELKTIEGWKEDIFDFVRYNYTNAKHGNVPERFNDWLKERNK